jgi:hypothetical protein
MEGGVMNIRQLDRTRKLQIIAVADEMREDSFDGHGLDPINYERDDLFDCVENCVGFKLTEPEHRLAIVAFEEGHDVAAKSIWF